MHARACARRQREGRHAELLFDLAQEAFFRRLVWLQVAAERRPCAGVDDLGLVVAVLQKEAAVAVDEHPGDEDAVEAPPGALVDVGRHELADQRIDARDDVRRERIGRKEAQGLAFAEGERFGRDVEVRGEDVRGEFRPALTRSIDFARQVGLKALRAPSELFLHLAQERGGG